MLKHLKKWNITNSDCISEELNYVEEYITNNNNTNIT